MHILAKGSRAALLGQKNRPLALQKCALVLVDNRLL